MDIIYEASFFLALGLLAIEITIFVFAVSLLGRAMEAAVAREKDKLSDNQRSNTEELTTIRKEIEEGEVSGHIPSGLTRKLRRLEKRERNFRKELQQIRLAPTLLTGHGCDT